MQWRPEVARRSQEQTEGPHVCGGMLRSLTLVLLAGCGGTPPAPTTPTPNPTPHITITSPRAGMKMHYRTCSDQGYVSIASTPDPARSWTTRPATESDLSRDRTIEGGVPAELPAWIADRGDLTVRATGMDRAAFDGTLAGIDIGTGVHVVGGRRLPWPGVLDGVSFDEVDAFYGARFTHYSTFGGMAQRPITPIAGAPFRWGRYDQPRDDHGRGPLIPGWHGEFFLGRVVFEVDAAGNRTDEASFLAFAEQVVRAALTDPDPTCRDRPGRSGAGYRQSPTDVVQLIGSELEVDRNNTRVRVGVGDDGTIRADGRPIGRVSVNGYVFRWVAGTPELLGVVNSRTNKFTFEASKQEIAIDLATADRAGYRGDPAGRLMAALALLLI